MPISAEGPVNQIDRDIREARMICETKRALFDERLALPDNAKYLGDALRNQRLKPDEWYGFITETLPAQREQSEREHRELRAQRKDREAAAKRAAKPSDHRPKRRTKTTEHVSEIKFTEQQDELIARLREVKVSEWDTLTELNFEHFAATGRYFTYDEAQAKYAQLKQQPAYAWWADARAEIGRSTARNLVSAFVAFSKAGSRNFKLLEQRQVDSYRFTDVRFVKRKRLEFSMEPINSLALRFPYLGNVKLIPRDRHERHFLENAGLHIKSARVWKSLNDGVWHVVLRYSRLSKSVTEYAVAQAVNKLWPQDTEFLPTDTILAELNAQGIVLHSRALAACMKKVDCDKPQRKKINGVPVRGYYRPTESAEDRKLALLVEEQLRTVDEPEPAPTPFKRKQLPPLPIAQPRKRLPPVQLAQPVITPEPAAIYAKLAQLRQEIAEHELQTGSATGLTKLQLGRARGKP